MLLYLVILISLPGIWSQCPSPESIAPACMCKFAESWHEFPTMTCSNLTTSDELQHPIKALKASYKKMRSFNIFNSNLLYIPRALFKGTRIEEIKFEKSNIMSLSDSELAFEGLEDTLFRIEARYSQYVAHWDWTQIRNLCKLQEIEAAWVPMGSIDQPFPELKELTKVYFVRTEINYIVDRAFAKLPKLRYLHLSRNDITEIKRSMLPEPANELRGLYLSDNKIEMIPKGFFDSMPLIFQVNLDYNKIITLPENVFKRPLHRLFTLRLEGNKLRCDCRLQWLDGLMSPYEFVGTCAEPPSLAGKDIKFLDFKDLWC